MDLTPRTIQTLAVRCSTKDATEVRGRVQSGYGRGARRLRVSDEAREQRLTEPAPIEPHRVRIVRRDGRQRVDAHEIGLRDLPVTSVRYTTLMSRAVRFPCIAIEHDRRSVIREIGQAYDRIKNPRGWNGNRRSLHNPHGFAATHARGTDRGVDIRRPASGEVSAGNPERAGQRRS